MQTRVEKLTGAQRRVLILLVLSVWINYIDRANLSVAAPQLRAELGLSPASLGILLSAFFWTYAGLQIPAGWAVDRLHVSWVFAVCYAVWSLATAATGMAGGFTALLACRLILGVGESVAYPAYSNILANHFPQSRLALANALIDAGSKMGPFLGTLLGGLLVTAVGWRVFFIMLGLAGLLWLVPWAAWAPRRQDQVEKAELRNGAASGPAPPLAEIVKVRQLWGCSLAHFGGNYFLYFLVTWLPTYLVEGRKFSMQLMAVLGSMPFVVIAFSTIAAGWLSDRLIQRGASVTKVRLGFAASGLAGATIVLLVPWLEAEWKGMLVLHLAAFMYGVYSSNLWAITQTLAGPAAAGKWSGLQNCAGNMAGVVAPAITGYVVAWTGRFYLAFLACAVVLIAGSLSYILIVRKVERVHWSTSAS